MKITSKQVRDYFSWRTDEELRHCPDCISMACNDVVEDFKTKRFKDKTIAACVVRYGDHGKMRKGYYDIYKKRYPDRAITEEAILDDMFTDYSFFLDTLNSLSRDSSDKPLVPMIFCDDEKASKRFHRHLQCWDPISCNIKWDNSGNCPHTSSEEAPSITSFENKFIPTVLDMFLMRECDYLLYNYSGFSLLSRLALPNSRMFRIYW